MTVSDDEDEANFQRAIALSLQSQSEGEIPVKQEASESVTTSAVSTQSLNAIDRKTMEAERLARLHARQQSVKRPKATPSPDISPRKAPRIEQESISFPSGARLNMIVQTQPQPTTLVPGVHNNSQRVTQAQKPAPNDQLTFPKGVVKYTWAFGQERTPLDIKIEEVLELPTLKTAVLSAYQWDTDWLIPKLTRPDSGRVVKCVFIMGAKEQALRDQIMEDIKTYSFLRVCFPPMEGQTHCMHSKLMLLFHPHKLRIAIPSANLRNFDWGETGEMENSVFIIDLPRRTEVDLQSRDELTPFGQELLFFLEKQTMFDEVIQGVLKFDFANTNDIAFVHTLGGTYYRDDAERTGTPGLSRAVRCLGLNTSRLEIDFAASSVGSLDNTQLDRLLSAARGENDFQQAESALVNTKANFFKKRNPGAEDKSVARSRDQIRVYFPTHKTVTASIAGSTHTICARRQWVEGDKFPRSIFRNYQSRRNGLLSHNKLMYARGLAQTETSKKAVQVSWLYIGSANMSESAWGRLSKDKRKGDWKVMGRNWECGVLLPVRDSVGEATASGSSDHIAIVKTEIDVKQEDSETESETDIPSPKDQSTATKEDSETESEVELEHSSANCILEGIHKPREIERAEAQRNPQNQNLSDIKVFDSILPPPFVFPGEPYGNDEPWYHEEAPS